MIEEIELEIKFPLFNQFSEICTFAILIQENVDFFPVNRFAEEIFELQSQISKRYKLFFLIAENVISELRNGRN